MKLNKKNLLVTTGDADGVGFEVAAKALVKLPAKFFKSTRVFLFVTPKYQARYFEQLKRHFFLNVVNSTSLDFDLWDLGSKSKKPVLNFIIAADSPADWIFNLAKICLYNATTTALVTGPLSKTLIKNAGYPFIGHTEILSHVTKTKSLYMGFVGKHFNVVLLTGHIPLSRVSKKIKGIDWTNVFKIVSEFRSGLAKPRNPVAIVGLNPHAGEMGMISLGEEELLSKKIKLDKYDLNIKGPLVPDAAFLKSNWSKYSVYLCPYHDQGLIPFKTIHGQDSGVHITLGLPFVRTSVDHGTAKELYGKNLANSNSMKEALLLAVRLLP